MPTSTASPSPASHARSPDPAGSPKISSSDPPSRPPSDDAPTPRSPPTAAANGAVSPPLLAPSVLPKKPTMSSRITGMFTRRDDLARSAAPSPAPEEGASSKSKLKGVVARQPSQKTSPVPSARSGTPANGTKPEDPYRRFWVNEDGEHEHFLRAAKRQQKLIDVFRGWFEKKEGPVEDQPPSLRADWVTQKRSEQDKDKAPVDAKGGPTQSHTLVQKYGKCSEIIGHGAFGVVRIAHKVDVKDPKREQLFAVKEFHQRPGESDRRYQKRLTSEFCISSSMQHPNVIQTLDLLKDEKGDYCEVMEYCAGGDLYTLILASGTLEAAEADCFFKQLMRGVEYIHEMGVSHRDLKPENLLLTQHGAIKITDFGNGECFRMAWEKQAHMTAGICGSAPYIAPEEYVSEEFDPRAVDVWSCGVIYMAMRTGRHLWRVAQKDKDEFYTRYLEDRREESGFRPIEVLRRAKCRNVIYSILDPNPSRRLTAHQVLLSEWVKDVKICRAGEQGF